MLTDDELIAGLFRYIQRNKTLPYFFQAIKDQIAFRQKNCHAVDEQMSLYTHLDCDCCDEDLKIHLQHCDALKKAIETGDHQAAIFSHRDCSSYLLFLIKEKEIPFWQGITVYFYCMMLMQFSLGKPDPHQRLREADADYCSSHALNVYSFVFSNGNTRSLTPLAHHYLECVEKRFAQYPWLHFDRDKVTQTLLTGSAVDAWVFEIDITLMSRAVWGFPSVAAVVIQDILYWMPGENKKTLFPSMAVVNAIHAGMCDQPINLMPIFGVISQSTLLNLHKQEIHALQLYSPAVEKNLTAAKEHRWEPVMGFLHDIAHGFMANMFSSAQRQELMKETITFVESYNGFLETEHQEKIKKAIESLVFDLSDYNLAPIRHYSEDHQDWMLKYVVSAFGRDSSQRDVRGVYAKQKEFKNTDAWNQEKDDLLYLSGRMRIRSDFWNRVYEENLASAQGKRNPKVVEEIVAAVNRVMP